MAVPFSNTTLRVPHGFPNLLEGLAREVLRYQPKDIYGFGARYFEELLKKREETGIEDLAQLGAKLDDRYYNNKAYCTGTCSINNAEHQEAAVRIQAEYRRHLAVQETEHIREENAATRIQCNYRGYRDRKLVKSLKEKKDNEGIQQETEKQSEHSESSNQENILSDTSSSLNNQQIPKKSEELKYNTTEAAIKIQSSYRNHLERKRRQSISKIKRALSIIDTKDESINESDSESNQHHHNSSSTETSRFESRENQTVNESSIAKTPEIEDNRSNNSVEDEKSSDKVDNNKISVPEENLESEEPTVDEVTENSNEILTEDKSIADNTQSEDQTSDKTPRKDEKEDVKKAKNPESDGQLGES
uniref:RIIa domain-containing protein n=1 Tax=Trichobilharzia regenti TaxID=157069 RepID=A0AA85JLY3_TRIRE|nr:unnamed protein product [Trichobilharzia regenti]